FEQVASSSADMSVASEIPCASMLQRSASHPRCSHSQNCRPLKLKQPRPERPVAGASVRCGRELLLAVAGRAGFGSPCGTQFPSRSSTSVAAQVLATHRPLASPPPSPPSPPHIPPPPT